MITSAEFSAKGDLCFYCRKPVRDPAISLPLVWQNKPEWVGTVSIFPHPVCAVDFLLRLARDIHEAQCMGALPEFSRSEQQHKVRQNTGGG